MNKSTDIARSVQPFFQIIFTEPYGYIKIVAIAIGIGVTGLGRLPMTQISENSDIKNPGLLQGFLILNTLVNNSSTTRKKPLNQKGGNHV